MTPRPSLVTSQLRALNDRLRALGVHSSEWRWSRSRNLFYRTSHRPGVPTRHPCYFTYEGAEVDCGVAFHIRRLVDHMEAARSGDPSAVDSYNHHVDRLRQLHD